MAHDSTQNADARFRELARELGVVSFTCTGEYGPFEGAVDDEVVHGTYFREGAWSPGILDLLEHRFFADGIGTFIDIGANIGLVSIPVAERCKVACLAFEPEPLNFSLLQRNIGAHGLASRIEAFHVALFSRKCQLQLECTPSNSGDNRLKPGGDPASSGKTFVAADRLDALIDPERLAHPIVVKMDTQGAEVRVLKGAEKVLPHVDYLISEYWPRGLWLMGDDPAGFQALVKAFAFGSVLTQDDSPLVLGDTKSAVFDRLSWIPADGSDDGFFDIILSRHPELPGGVNVPI